MSNTDVSKVIVTNDKAIISSWSLLNHTNIIYGRVRTWYHRINSWDYWVVRNKAFKSGGQTDCNIWDRL